VVFATLGCGGDGAGPPSAASSARSSTTSAVPAPSAASSETPAPTGARRLDLTSRGLPIAITVPACAKARAPLLKNEDNDKDVILACDPVLGDPRRPFAIQLGLAKAKVWKADVRKNPGFKRFTTDEANLLRWEAVDGADRVEEFMLRQKVGSTDYACFPQFPALEAQRALLEEELAACRSVTAP
jgi:hypothetical protein